MTDDNGGISHGVDIVEAIIVYKSAKVVFDGCSTFDISRFSLVALKNSYLIDIRIFLD